LRDIVACEAAVGIRGSGVTSGRPARPARRNLHTSYTPPPCHCNRWPGASGGLSVWGRPPAARRAIPTNRPH